IGVERRAVLQDPVADHHQLAQARPHGRHLGLAGGDQPPEEAAMPRCTPALPPLGGITRVGLTRIEVWDRGQRSAWWLGQCRDCLAVYWCDDRGEETWPPPPG